MKIYFDACCLNRPFDNQSLDRIRLESEAVLLILNHVQNKQLTWISSDILDFEIDQTPDYERRHRLKLIILASDVNIKADKEISERGRKLYNLGFKELDALHIACAEKGKADLFLTTDDKLISTAKRCKNNLNVIIKNPLIWTEEKWHL